MRGRAAVREEIAPSRRSPRLAVSPRGRMPRIPDISAPRDGGVTRPKTPVALDDTELDEFWGWEGR